MLQISLQYSGGKVVFYGWVPRTPPWAPTGVKVPWSLKCSDRYLKKGFKNALRGYNWMLLAYRP